MKRFDLGGTGKGSPDGYQTINLTDSPDVNADILDVEGYCPNDGSADEFRLCHTLEHVPSPDYVEFLFALRRKLRAGGVLRVIQSDCGSVLKQYVEGELSFRAMRTVLFPPADRLQRNLLNRHFQMWSEAELVKDLEVVGFEVSTFDAGFWPLDTTDELLPEDVESFRDVPIRNLGIIAKKPEIPRVVHQSSRSADTAAHGERSNAWRKSWANLDGVAYREWTDEDVRELYVAHYPAWLPVHDLFDQTEERDALARYFILHRFGGLYVDVDAVCLRNMDTLLGANDLLFSFRQSGSVNTAVLGAAPGHPVIEETISRLAETTVSVRSPAEEEAVLTSVVYESFHLPEVLPSELIQACERDERGAVCRMTSVEGLRAQFPEAFALTHLAAEPQETIERKRLKTSQQATLVAQKSARWLLRPGHQQADLVFHLIPGWLSEDEAKALYAVTRNTSGRILEIGHFLGRSTSCICQAISASTPATRSRVFRSFDLGHTTVDEFREFFEKIHQADSIEIPVLFQEWVSEKGMSCTEVARKFLSEHALDSFVELVTGDFRVQSKCASYSLIFSDACHEPHEILENLPSIVELSTSRAVWAFHDMTDENVRVVLDYCPNARHVVTVGSLGLFRLVPGNDHRTSAVSNLAPPYRSKKSLFAIDFMGGLGDMIRQVHRHNSYQILDNLKPEDVVDAIICTHNPHSFEILANHPSRNQIRIHQINHKYSEFMENGLRGQEIVLAAYEFLDIPIGRRVFDSTMEGHEIHWHGRNLHREFDSYITFSSWAGNQDRTWRTTLIEQTLMWLLDSGVIVVGLGRGSGCNIAIDHPRFVNMTEIDVPSTLQLVQHSSGFVGAHSSLLQEAWFRDRPTLVWYPDRALERPLPGSDSYDWGIHKQNCISATFGAVSIESIVAPFLKIVLAEGSCVPGRGVFVSNEHCPSA